MRRFSALLAVLPVAVASQSPPEVTGLHWCAGSKACLRWDAVASVSGYNLYRGDQTTLPALLNANQDSCQLAGFGVNTSGDVLNANPPPGGLHWYLVTAVNLNGEGSPGSASSGPEAQDANGTCDAAGGACPSTCESTASPPGPRPIAGFGCGCYDDYDCSGWGMFCHWRSCVNNRCIEIGAIPPPDAGATFLP
jgi:hypothetical protein